MKTLIVLIALTIGLPAHTAPLDFLFEPAGKKRHAGLRTDALLVIKNEKVLFERYARGYDKDKKHLVWSIAKTITSALLGVAHREGLFQMEDSVCKYRKTKNPEQCKITIQDLMFWSSGIKWIEDYEKSPSPTHSSVLALLYGEGHKSMFDFVSGLPLAHPPGTKYRYSSGDSMMIAGLLPAIFKTKDISKTAKEKLFDPLEMNITFETDLNGDLISSSFAYLTARSLANFGQMYINGGTFKGRRIINEDWVAKSRVQAPAYKNSPENHVKAWVGGAHWWLNDLDTDGDRPYPAAPEDMLMASGHWGQILMLFPSQNMIIVRYGDNRHKKLLDRNRMIREAFEVAAGGLE